MRIIFKIAKTELVGFVLFPDCLVDFDYIHVSNGDVVFRNNFRDCAIPKYGGNRI